MWTVLGTIVGIFLGALLGALFGYWFALHQQAQELSAHREVLLGLLNREMAQIAPTLGPYEVGKAYYRDPIRLSAPSRLLDGQTLNYQEDRRLIELLLNLNVSVARHNDFVQMTNQAQATIPVPDNIHAQWFRDIQERTAAVAAVRDEILKDLNRKK